jgi:hypothetical protein
LLDGWRELARFAFAGADFAQEKAVMLFELYRKDGGWRYMAVGQGSTAASMRWSRISAARWRRQPPSLQRRRRFPCRKSR